MDEISFLSTFKIPEKQIEISDLIGKGGYGVVSRASYKRKDQTEVTVALKVFFDLKKQKPNFLKEMGVTFRMQHCNILKLIGYVQLKDHYGLVLELMENGNLYELLHDDLHNSIQYSESHAIWWALQCARAMLYIHSMNITHRDLKPGNLLLSNCCKILKVCDFGISRVVETNMTCQKGTFRWMAPELFRESADKKTIYSNKCDVYSFAVVLWEILCRRIPFEGMEDYQVYDAVFKEHKRLPLIQNCPEILSQLIFDCWKEEAEDRRSFQDIVDILQNIFSKCRVDDIVDLNLKEAEENHIQTNYQNTNSSVTSTGENLQSNRTQECKIVYISDKSILNDLFDSTQSLQSNKLNSHCVSIPNLPSTNLPDDFNNCYQFMCRWDFFEILKIADYKCFKEEYETTPLIQNLFEQIKSEKFPIVKYALFKLHPIFNNWLMSFFLVYQKNNMSNIQRSSLSLSLNDQLVEYGSSTPIDENNGKTLHQCKSDSIQPSTRPQSMGSFDMKKPKPPPRLKRSLTETISNSGKFPYNQNVYEDKPEAKVKKNLFKNFVLNQIIQRKTRETFENRWIYFHEQLKLSGYNSKPKVIQLKIPRLFELKNIYANVMKIESKMLREYPLQIIYNNVECQDFFKHLVPVLFSPKSKLFLYCDEEKSLLKIDPNSSNSKLDNYLKRYQFCGRIIGLAISEKMPLPAFFHRPFYKLFLEHSMYTVSDVQYLEQALYNHLAFVNSNKLSVLNQQKPFTFAIKRKLENVSEEKIILKENGTQIKVTEENKREYIHLLAKWRMENNCHKIIKALLKGFDEVINRNLLNAFDPYELELMISGYPSQDMDTWQLIDISEQKDKTKIEWLELIITKHFSQNQKIRFLQIVTGTSCVSGEIKILIDFSDSQHDMPIVDMTLNKLVLPPYETFEMLQTKLKIFLENNEYW